MSQAEDNFSAKDAEKAMQNDDKVTEDELQDIYKDLTTDQIYAMIEKENQALEMESNLKHPYEKTKSSSTTRT